MINVNPKPVTPPKPLPKPPVAPPAPPAAPAKPEPTPLQKHVMYFDGNKDGQITRKETQEGLKKLGMGGVSSYLGSLFINLGLFQARGKEGINLQVDKIHKAKHGSDSGAFDDQGRLVRSKVDGIFQHDANRSGSMTGQELAAMKKANKTDAVGAIASKAEFGLLLQLGADTTEVEGGKTVPALSRARMEALYDGTLFQTIADERAAKAKK